VPENTPSDDSIIIYPTKTTVKTGNSWKFNVSPGNSKVKWTINGAQSSGTRIDPTSGFLQIAEDETAAALTVVASLISYPAKKSAATVIITHLAIPATAANSFSNGIIVEGSAIDLIKGYKSAQPLVIKLAAASTKESVDLGGSDQDIHGGLVLDSANSPADVTIDGGGRTVTMTGAGQGSVITVGAGVTLTLRNITFEGLTNGKNYAATNNNAALFRVKDGGQLVLEEGAKITGNTHPGSNATYNGSPFSETGYPSGGGVVVHDGGFLTMTGTSEISGNSAKHGGGVAVHTGGFLTMIGGKISGNTAATGGGVFLVNNGSLDMSGTAVIRGNNASGGNGGGVIMYASTFTMIDDAAVRNNHAPGSRGGGLHIHSGTFEMSGNAAISDNTAGPNGGGISSEGGTFDMSGNARINGNSANGGGGVYVGGGMVFTMDGGEIYSNKATGGRGGGVLVASNSTFTMNSGKIYGSNADPAVLANTDNSKGTAAAFVSGTNSNVGSSDYNIIRP
jgi:hypothetical protein